MRLVGRAAACFILVAIAGLVQAAPARGPDSYPERPVDTAR